MFKKIMDKKMSENEKCEKMVEEKNSGNKINPKLKRLEKNVEIPKTKKLQKIIILNQVEKYEIKATKKCQEVEKFKMVRKIENVEEIFF